MEEEKVLNAALIKKSLNFCKKYYRQPPPARSSSWFLSQLESPSLSGSPEAVPTPLPRQANRQSPPKGVVEAPSKKKKWWILQKGKFGETARPYLVPYIYDREFLDKQYGIRKSGDYYMIVDSNVSIDDASDIYVKKTGVSKAPKASGNC
jgi:hypothetical protein